MGGQKWENRIKSPLKTMVAEDVKKEGLITEVHLKDIECKWRKQEKNYRGRIVGWRGEELGTRARKATGYSPIE